MKRIGCLAAAAVVLLGAAWMAFMGFVNTRHTTLDVQVSGGVEQVQFFAAANPGTPLAEIVTHGQDTRAAVALPNSAALSWWAQSPPAQYYFVTSAGAERYRSPSVCCETGLLDRREPLIIRGLRDWEKPGR